MIEELKLISVILPTYNEAGNIIRLIKQISNQLKSYSFEILVVDDDSSDKTAQLVKDKFSKIKRVKVFIRKKDRGLARSILFGIGKSRGTFIIVMDTDFNHDPADLPRLLQHRNNYDLVIGSRYISGGGMEDKLRYVLSYLYNLTIQKVLSLTTHDNLSGFFLIKKPGLEQLDNQNIFRGYGDYFIRLLKAAHQKHLRIKEIPVYYKNRFAGQSKSQFIPMFFEYSKTVIDILRQGNRS